MDTFVFSGTGFFVQLLNIIVLAALIGAFVLLVLALLKYLRRKEINSQRMCIQKSLGENIREKRVQLKMTQEFVAERIGVSRNAVWKGIKSLKADGHIITAVTNKGYCLSENSSIFTAQSVYANLSSALREKLVISVVPEVGSTNTELKALAEKGGADGTVLIAVSQTAGRGRLGRSFYSPKDTGLYMSVLLRPDFSASEALNITACAAVSAAKKPKN